MIKITVTEGANEPRTIDATHGERLQDVLNREHIHSHAPCGGRGTCGKCGVVINNRRELACQTVITTPLCVETAQTPAQSAASIMHESLGHARIITLDPGISKSISDGVVSVSYKQHEIVQTFDEADSANNCFGFAVDIGTTTVAVYLVNLHTGATIDTATFINPQTSFGHDVISRITHCIEKSAGLTQLRQAIVKAINKAVTALCHTHAISTEHIYKCTIAGNTIMLHLFCGIDPRSIAFAPFTPVFTEEKILSGAQAMLAMHPDGIVKVLPSIAGYVGADIVAGIASTTLADEAVWQLFIDIGTNGEIALGNRDTIICCATAAGPAFEGATIQCGMGGIAGAIDHYSAAGYTTIGGGRPHGICGSGLIDITAHLVTIGTIDMTGLMEADFVLAVQGDSDTDHDIVLTPADVRQVQLAKAAIYAGIKTLINTAGIAMEQIQRVYLAGGFGGYINIKSAGTIGLLPAPLLDKIVVIGNSAGTGARFALLSVEFEAEIEKVVARARYLELSMRPDFNDEYVMAMMFESAV